MAVSSQHISIVGNLADDPELRFTPNGHAVCVFRVCVSDRRYNKTTNEWEDTDPWWVTCKVWRDFAEHVAESLSRGNRVVVTGRMEQRTYDAKDGSGKRVAYELQADEVAASLKFATVSVKKMQRSKSKSAASAEDDPWLTNKQQEIGDEPPF